MKSKTNPKLEARESASDHSIVHRKMVSAHIRQLHELIDQIVWNGDEPANWPLTQQEQIHFIRTVIFKARKIRNSEGYVTLELMRAAEDLAMAS